MEIELSTTILANEDNQEALNAFAKVIRREGVILDRFDKETDAGFRSGFFIEYEGFEYMLRMLNGCAISVRKLWEIEEI